MSLRSWCRSTGQPLPRRPHLRAAGSTLLDLAFDASPIQFLRYISATCCRVARGLAQESATSVEPAVQGSGRAFRSRCPALGTHAQGLIPIEANAKLAS